MNKYKVRFYLSYSQEIMANDEEHAKEIIANYYCNEKPIINKVYPIRKQHCLNCDTGFTNKKNRAYMKFCSDKCRFTYNYKTKWKFLKKSNPEYYLKNRDRLREYNKNYYHNVLKPKRKELKRCN